MQYLDDDMDELFREAAENYPLKVTGADWSKVQAGLPKTSPVAEANTPNRKNMLWLLLLLFIPLVCTVFNNRNHDENTGAGKITSVIQPDKILPAENSTVRQNSSTVNIAATIPANDQIKNNAVPVSTNAINHIAITAAVTGKTHSSSRRSLVSTTAGDVAVTGDSKTFSQKAATQLQVMPGEPGSDEAQDPANKKAQDRAKEKSMVKQEPITDNTKKNIVKQEPVTDQAEKNKKPAEPSSTAKQEKQKKQNSRGIYISLLGGPDFSTVKNDGVKKIGLSTGMNIGYNINKHFAVEAAAFYSEKHYKSQYKNFNNTKTQWPTGATITNLKGTCKMIELPVTLRYNFNILKKNKFFAAAGLSSYIMKKEAYGYNYSGNNGYGYSYSGYTEKSYNNSSRNWLSVLQLSAGLQRNIGKKLALRVQPYYNVPLKGVGIGSLPISGAGLLAGITIPIK